MPDKGFTLPEILIATTVFLLMVAGIIAANLFGLQMFQITDNQAQRHHVVPRNGRSHND